MPLTSITSKTTMYNSKEGSAKKGAAKGTAKSAAKGAAKGTAKGTAKGAPKKGSAKKRSPEFLKRIEDLKKRAASLKAKRK